MKIEYTLTESDQLTHQLFLASQSKRIRKRRAQGKIFLLLIYMATGLFIWDRNGPVIAAVFFMICLPLYFIYAYMERRQYIKHFSAFIATHYKEQLQKKTIIDFTADRIDLTDGVNENVIPLSEIEGIFEIKELYSISLKSGQSFFIPKVNQDVPHDLNSFFHQLADKNEIPYVQDLNWKWR